MSIYTFTTNTINMNMNPVILRGNRIRIHTVTNVFNIVTPTTRTFTIGTVTEYINVQNGTMPYRKAMILAVAVPALILDRIKLLVIPAFNLR
jgi:hypothetical protein